MEGGVMSGREAICLVKVGKRVVDEGGEGKTLLSAWLFGLHFLVHHERLELPGHQELKLSPNL